MDDVWYWEKQLVKPQQRDEWMETVYKRSQAMLLIYLENQKQFSKLFEELEENMSDKVREGLYQMLLDLFYANGYDDAVLMLHIAQKLLPYYETVKDDIHVINLLHVEAFVATEYFYRQNRHSEKLSYNTFHGKIYAYRNKYKELPLKERHIILANYHNIICTLPTLIPHELNCVLDIYDDFLGLIQDDEIMKIEKGDKTFIFHQNNIQSGIWNAAVIIEHFDRPHLLHFYELLKKEYEKRKEISNEKIPAFLADTILEQIIQNRPALLLSLPFYKTAADVQKNAEKLHDYVSHAAFYHDIGKNRIAAVINQQIRKLSDDEFALIRQHPEHPETGVLKGSSNFVQYYDIIAGHHKSYDGKTGYPAYFDNVHSPFRILIDLITICDCLDASTDRLGRNYAGGKKFEEVLLELKQGMGTRYNPDIVNLILENETLKKDLNTIVTDGRQEVYYQTYKEYFA